MTSPCLTDYFLARFAAELGMDNPGITEEAMAALKMHRGPATSANWPTPFKKP